MSTVQMMPSLEQVRRIQGKQNSSAFAPERREPIVHAWSIGVTEVVREFVEAPQGQSGHKVQEDCPPEVYIG